MIKTLKTTFAVLAIITNVTITHAQGMKMGEVLIMNNATLKKDVDPAAFESYLTKELAPSLRKNKAGVSMHLFRADRGDRKGQFLIVSGIRKVDNTNELPSNSPLITMTQKGNKRNRLSDFLSTPDSYTQYRLIGADRLKSLPVAGILGIHYIKVKLERAAEFEKFVVDKLHPAVAQLFPDMQLLYYKAVAGENTGSYITIFTIESVAARDKYWPSGKPETELLKQAFRPLNDLAVDLGSYFVEGSYLEPASGGAASYWESKEWTDFIHYKFLN